MSAPVSPSPHDHDDHIDGGFSIDLHTMSRRRALAFLGTAGAGALALAACGGGSSSGADTTAAGSTPATTPATTTPATTTPATTTAATTTPATTTPATTAAATTAAGTVATVGQETPDETAGPYPGDGSNGPNVLTESGIVRSDLTASTGGAGGVADGVPLTFTLAIVDVAARSALVGAAVYAWHCDAAGDYSMYSDATADENYLRGVQEADANGQVTFRSVVPGCYPGRWPHIHFEVYADLAAATDGANAIKTTQLAFPQAMCEAVYGDDRYPDSARHLSQLSLATDNVFSDDQAVHQLAVVTGSTDAGYVATLAVGV